MASESVAALNRNQWPFWIGISGRFGSECALYEDPYDCLACKDGSALLIEVKTLDGSPSDERRQAERALGQVKGYRHFDLPEELDARKVTELIAFSQKPTDEMRGFLNATGALVVWPAEDDSWWWSTVDGDVLPFEPHRMA